MSEKFVYITEGAIAKINALAVVNKSVLLSGMESADVANEELSVSAIAKALQGKKFFRIEVKGGGCYGYTYDYTIDDNFDSDEDGILVFESISGNDEAVSDVASDGVKFVCIDCSSERAINLNALSRCVVVSDRASVGMISGSVLDYKVELSGEEFVMKNPKVSSKCGCGISFSL